MVVGLLGNENPDLNRFTLVTPKPANGVRLQATLDNQNPTGLPVGAVREYKEGRLGYNRKNDRYGLLVTDLWEIDGFSCGNRLQVEINGEWVDTHMEMDWSTGKGIWYLTGTDLKGSALENKRVRVLRDR